mmetsp:Transcript_30381/g.92779  ORF Transcript_30381/g.92779 Transcript_30381/m.92779 type:complete len:263 (+) Transcript_30381:1013-1801(+)
MSATYSPPCVYRSTAQRAPKPRNIAMSGGASVSPGRIQSSASMNSTTSSEPTTTQKESAAATSAPLLSSGIAALLEGPLGLGESLALPNARQAPFSLAALSAVRKSGRLSGRALTSKSVLAASADRGSLRPVISLTNSTALPAASALPPLESRESRTALYRSAGARDENASSNLEPKGVMEEEEGPSESDGGGERREECDEKRRGGTSNACPATTSRSSSTRREGIRSRWWGEEGVGAKRGRRGGRGGKGTQRESECRDRRG